jgi:hypothetical protein
MHVPVQAPKVTVAEMPDEQVFAALLTRPPLAQ